MSMLVGTCHCAAIRIEVPGRPAWLIDCNCSICRRNGALWALYETGEVRIVARPESIAEYIWGRRYDQDDVVRPLRHRHPLGADTGRIKWQARCEHEELRSAGSRVCADTSIRWRRNVVVPGQRVAALAARDQEFTVANVIRVTAGVEIHDFPPFPRGGLLVVLDPPCLVADHELKGCAAEVTPENGSCQDPQL